jgi:type I restriction enzyme S subunit
MSIAATVGVPIITGIPTCIHDGFVAIERLRGVNQTYLLYVLKSLEGELRSAGQTGSQSNVNTEIVNGLLINLPPEPDQKRIAEVLWDADDQIATLERLITKKQAIKQGMMQQLLTGKTRLSGFTAPWRAGVSLGNLCEKRSGYWGSDTITPSADIVAGVIRAGDISGDGHLVGTAVRYLSSSEWNKASCHVDDVVITASGNRLGKTFYVRTPSKLAASNFVRILRPRASVSGEYLAYVMQSSKARQELEAHTATSAYPNLLPSFFAEPWLIVPSYDEQIAIVTVLRSSDAQIDALRIRLTKAKDIKQGMMQELLTGRTRLALEKGRHE